MGGTQFAKIWGARVTSLRVLTKHVEMIVPTIALCTCTPKDGCSDIAAALDDDDADGRRTKFSLSWKKMIFHSLSAAYDTSHVTSHTSHVTCHKSHVTRHTSHVTRHTSHVTRHTSHVTRHTSHVTRHTSHVTRHTSHC